MDILSMWELWDSISKVYGKPCHLNTKVIAQTPSDPTK